MVSNRTCCLVFLLCLLLYTVAGQTCISFSTQTSRLDVTKNSLAMLKLNFINRCSNDFNATIFAKVERRNPFYPPFCQLILKQDGSCSPNLGCSCPKQENIKQIIISKMVNEDEVWIINAKLPGETRELVVRVNVVDNDGQTTEKDDEKKTDRGEKGTDAESGQTRVTNGEKKETDAPIIPTTTLTALVSGTAGFMVVFFVIFTIVCVAVESRKHRSRGLAITTRNSEVQNHCVNRSSGSKRKQRRRRRPLYPDLNEAPAERSVHGSIPQYLEIIMDEDGLPNLQTLSEGQGQNDGHHMVELTPDDPHTVEDFDNKTTAIQICDPEETEDPQVKCDPQENKGSEKNCDPQETKEKKCDPNGTKHPDKNCEPRGKDSDKNCDPQEAKNVEKKCDREGTKHFDNKCDGNKDTCEPHGKKESEKKCVREEAENSRKTDEKCDQPATKDKREPPKPKVVVKKHNPQGTNESEKKICDPRGTEVFHNKCDPKETKDKSEPQRTDNSDTKCASHGTEVFQNKCETQRTKDSETKSAPHGTEVFLTICDPKETKDYETKCDPHGTEVFLTKCDPKETKDSETKCETQRTEISENKCVPHGTQLILNKCDPHGTEVLKIKCDPKETKTSDDKCSPYAVTAFGPYAVSELYPGSNSPKSTTGFPRPPGPRKQKKNAQLRRGDVNFAAMRGLRKVEGQDFSKRGSNSSEDEDKAEAETAAAKNLVTDADGYLQPFPFVKEMD